MDPNATTPPKRLSTYTPQSDASKYIRTYAKDVARITNTPVPEPEPNEKNNVEDEKREAAALGVALPEFDASPVNHKDGASPKEFKQEVVQLSEADSKDIFKGQSAPAATPLMPQASIGVVETVAPPAPPAATEADREAVLARLRAKIATPPETAPAVAVPPPVPLPTPEGAIAPAPVETVPLRTAAPNFNAYTATIPEAPAPAPQAPVAPAQAAPSPIHTFSSDFANQIDTQKGTAFSVLAAQSDAGQTPKSSSKGKKGLLPLFAGIAMLVVGIGAVTGAYLFVQKGTTAPTVSTVPSLITFDESVELQGTGAVLLQALADVAAEGAVSGNVIVTYVTNAVDETMVTSIPQPGGVFIKQLNLPAPDILLRNIQETSTVGVINAGSETRPFFILKVNSYERTFAGMLGWERNIADDLAVLYPLYPSIPFEPASTTASTTIPASTQAVSMETFEDDVVANYDVRVLRDSNGKSLIIYGYLGKDLLVIARDEAAFTALTTRLRASGN